MHSRARDRKWKMRFWIALLRDLADFATEIHSGLQKPEHKIAPNKRYEASYHQYNLIPS